MRETSSRLIVQLALGFLAVTLVMASVVMVGLFRMKSMHHELEEIIHKHNVKIELVQTMRHVVRERMIDMNLLVIEDDPFKRDETNMRFYGLANKFITARDQLERMRLTPQEQADLRKLRELTQWATPFNEQVVGLLARDQFNEAKRLLLDKALPAQVKVMDQCDKMLGYYKNAAEKVEEDAHRNYQRTVFLMVMLGGIACSLSFVTAMKVLDRAWKDRLSLTGEIERRVLVEQELVKARDNLEAQVAEQTAELRENVGRLAEAQQVSHMGHWEWNLEYDHMTWSDEVYRILGYSPRFFSAQYDKLLQAIHPDDRERLTVAIDTVLLDRVPFDLDCRIVQPSGTERIVHQQAKVDFDANGKLLKILGTIQDVTESRDMESKVRLAASVFENAGEGILITDKNNNIVDINHAFTQITGFKREEVLGKNPGAFKSGKHDPAFYRDMWNTLLEKGQWQGEIWGRRKAGSIFPKWQTINIIRDENNSITNYIAIFRDISDAKKNEERLWQLAHFDNLTGVANRSLMYANLRLAVSQAKRENLQVAMMLFDLDGFKQINDTMGHDAGDRLLKHVARQIMQAVREVDTVARLGGDEFTVILTGIRKPEDVAQVAKKIQAALAQPLKFQSGEEVIARASIGIALYPADAGDIEALMKNADRAMYHAKELGKNNFQFFTEGMSTETKPESPAA